jgi:hypothetical protein
MGVMYKDGSAGIKMPKEDMNIIQSCMKPAVQISKELKK